MAVPQLEPLKEIKDFETLVAEVRIIHAQHRNEDTHADALLSAVALLPIEARMAWVAERPSLLNMAIKEGLIVPQSDSFDACLNTVIYYWIMVDVLNERF